MSEKEINNDALEQQDYISSAELPDNAAANAAEEYGIFSFLADSPIFAIEKAIYEEPEKEVELPSAPKPVIEPVERSTSAVYDFIYYFGLQIIRRARKIGSIIKSVFYRPVHAITVFAGILFILFDKILMRSFHDTVQDFKKFRHASKASRKEVKAKAHLSSKERMQHLIKNRRELLKRHPNFVRTAVNTAIPLASLALLIITVSHWTGLTYALEVVVDNNGEECSLGYISDESVFIQARTIVKERIDSGAAGDGDTMIANPTYKITRVRLNELSDANAISDKLIENSDAGLVSACGIYIDGEFICSIKNETDARSVFNRMLDEAEEKYKIAEDDENSFADFVEDVEFVQGLYSDDREYMWEASKLFETLTTQKKSEAVYYTVKDGDTPSGVAQSFDISTSELMALNPQADFSIFKTGTELKISAEVDFVRVKIIRIIEKMEETPYKTETIQSDSLFRGDKRVIRKGVKGTDKVTYLTTFVDGIQISSEEIDRIVITEPTSEKVKVGTKKTHAYGTNYEIISKGRFVWPVSGLYTVTSHFGIRSMGNHKGIDISGPNASGKLILAADDGVVELAQYTSNGYGYQVLINHGGGVKTRYAHMLAGSISVSVGQRVTRGQAIGRVGNTGRSTGPHLHFEVIINGTKVNPYPYIS